MSGALVLLPPSENKATRPQGRAMDLERLSFPVLASPRAHVLDVLQRVSSRPDACEILGVPPSLAPAVARNLSLLTAPAMPVSQLYAGVLFDALDLASLDPSARRRANAALVVVSALYGALRMTDRVAGYRLAGSVRLPEIGAMAAFWRPWLSEALPAAVGDRLLVDVRSSTYVAAWRPTGDLTKRWVAVAVPGASHQAKHVRGLVARELCRTSAKLSDPQDLLAVIPHLQPRLAPPAGRGKPWVLSVGASSR